MNERIRKLAELAGYAHDRWASTEQFEQFLEKFAESIVRECASLAYDGPSGILEYFGVDNE